MFLSYVAVQRPHMSYLTALCNLLQEAVRLKKNHASIMLKTAFNCR